MSKSFRAWTIDQPQLLPATVGDFVAEDHLARFVLALAREHLDLKDIVGTYGSAKGQPPFDPVMMTALLLYAYSQGLYASRRIAKACRERVDVMSIVGLDAPDFRTISDFRKRHLKALSGLFVQVLRLCEQAGLVKLGHVALDGTKIKANASKHKAMSYERMEQRAAELEAEVAGWLAAAETADAADDARHGPDKTGEEMPAWIADKQKRAAVIRAAKAELEAEAKAAAEAKAGAQAEDAARRTAEGRKKPGPPAAAPSTAPDPKAQKNFTDPESRIMKSKDGFVQAYNAQAAVDAKAQVIVAESVTQDATDKRQLLPMVDAIETNLGRKPEQLSADAGYCSDENLAGLETRDIDGYIATGRAKHAAAPAGEAVAVADGAADGVAAAATPMPEPATVTVAPQTTAVAVAAVVATAGAPEAAAQAKAKVPGGRVDAMRAKIKAGGHASPYRLRKQLPEPVFGQIKQARGFRQFLLRGVDKVRGEWSIVCTAHNITKLFQGRSLSAASAAAA